MTDDELVRLNDRKYFQQKMPKEESPDWEMFTPWKKYSYGTNSPEIGLLNPTKEGMNYVLGQTMSIINEDARKVLHRTLDFKRLNHGYKRYHPQYGVQYMLDLLMKYHRHIGSNRRRMTVHVRHHAYLQMPFGNLVYTEDIRPTKETVNFILGLSGRLIPFKRFMVTFEDVLLKKKAKVSLVVAYFSEKEPGTKQRRIFDSLKKKYPDIFLKWIDMEGHFSRALSLSVGSAQHEKTSLLFFCDVDLVISAEFVDRCRANTIRGKQVYYPVVFSQFAPEVAFYKEQQPITAFVYSKNAGFWRHYAFGITCQYRSDFDAIGGFDTTIQGWGMEDVELYDRYVASREYTVLRSPDPGLIHVYHAVACDKNLSEKQLIMCYDSKAATYGSQRKLYDILLDHGYKA